MTPLIEALDAYIAAREAMKAIPDGTPEYRWALDHTIFLWHEVVSARGAM